MGERKVLNKYYPPDFDPSKIPRIKKAADQQAKVRLMAPFSMRCTTCGEWIAKGKKFNARKESAQGEIYLGIQIFRFYIRCPRCSAEITFKTDPKNSDYACEIGAARNFEPQRAEDTANASAAAAREEEEANNPMRALENRTADSRRELDIINSLEDLRSINAMKEKAKSSGDVIEWFNKEKEALEKRQEEDEEEEEIRRIFGRTEDGARLKRLVDDYNDDEEEEKSVKRVAVQQPVQVQVPVNVQPVKKMSAAMLGIKVKPKQG